MLRRVPKTWMVLVAATVLLVSTVPARSAEQAKPKSPTAAFFLSLLVPGTGELYAGGPRSGRFFLFTEGTFWSGMVAFRLLKSARESTFKSYAAVHAGARTEGKPDRYLDELAQYPSIYARNARARFVDGDLATLRSETPENIWEWDSEESRQKYQELRGKANSAKQKAFLFVGALVFNRFASTLNAVRIARKTRVEPASSPVRVGVRARPEGGVQAWLQRSF